MGGPKKREKTLDDAVVFDCEIYINYFLAAFKSVKTGKVLTFELGEGRELERAKLARVMSNQLTVGFNSNGFDALLVAMAINGFSVEKIKEAADMIIVGKMKIWEVSKFFGVRIPDWNTIDLMEVAPGKASLKIYNGRLHGKRMQDLPIDPTATLEEHEIEELKRYCINDLDATALLFKNLRKQIELRVSMTEEYGVDLRSKSDAQVAEAVIRTKIAEKLGIKPKEVQKPIFMPGQRITYQIPEFIRFRHPELRNLLSLLRGLVFHVNPGNGNPVCPKALENKYITIGETTYKFGIGGLHSTEKASVHVADEETELIDRDVESFYPRIILNQRLFPRHLGRTFLAVYNEIVERRIAAKKRSSQIKAEIGRLRKMLDEMGEPYE